MKIAMLSVFHPYRGGIAQFSGRLFRELEKQHEVKAFNFKRQYPSVLFPGKTQYVTADDHTDAVPNMRILDSVNPVTWHFTYKQVLSFNPDLYISRLWMPFFGPSFGYVSSRLKSSCVRLAIIDNVQPHEKHFFDVPFTRYFLNRHDGFIVMSKQVADDLIHYRPDARFILSPHPLYDHFKQKIPRHEACRLLSINEKKKILLYYGFVRKYKGLDLLIDSFSKLDEGYHLIIAGEWYEDSSEFERKIQPLSDRITFMNRYIGSEETRLLFSAADACTLTYLQATQSGVAAIAMHYEVPLVVTRAGGLFEPVEKYNIGLVANDFSADTIAGCINRLFSDGHAASFKNGFALLKQELSWSRFSEELISFYNKLKN
jgi:glycosyltransferase involved in cell wall biosynthesis